MSNFLTRFKENKHVFEIQREMIQEFAFNEKPFSLGVTNAACSLSLSRNMTYETSNKETSIDIGIRV